MIFVKIYFRLVSSLDEETLFSFLVTRGGIELHLKLIRITFLGDQNCTVLLLDNTFAPLLSCLLKVGLGFHYGCVSPISRDGVQ